MPTCIIGEYCYRHGFIHGAEAEELRMRIEAVIANPTLGMQAIQQVLDDVDARDSLAYCEASEVGQTGQER